MSKSAIVIAIEGLGTNMIGAYGGPWASTPNLDAFAAQAIVCDQFLLDTDSIAGLYRSMFWGQHGLAAWDRNAPTLLQRLEAKGLSSLLVHDAAWAADWIVPSFSESIDLTRDPRTALEVSEDDWETACMPETLGVALDAWHQSTERSSLLWIHCQGWNGPWDAPYVYREALGDEDDPPPPQGIDRPEEWFDAASDPDLLFGWTQAAAAQSKLLDQAWAWIDSALEDRQQLDDCLVILLGLGGYPLGEHGAIGPRLARPYAERMHVPCVIRPGKEWHIGRRIHSLTRPSDLHATLLSWFDNEVQDDGDPKSEEVSTPSRSLMKLSSSELLKSTKHLLPYPMVTAQGLGFRIGPWWALWNWEHPIEDFEERYHHVQSTGDGGKWGELPSRSSGVELYLLPEDRWQQNDIANRAGSVVEAIEAFADAWLAWQTSDATAAPPSIPSLLLDPPS